MPSLSLSPKICYFSGFHGEEYKNQPTEAPQHDQRFWIQHIRGCGEKAANHGVQSQHR